MRAPSKTKHSNGKYVFFIAHSTKDIKSDVGEVCKVLERCKIRSYIADRDAPLGKSLPEEIKRAIRGSELFLVFLTNNSCKSPWVNQEIGYALGCGRTVIPLKKGDMKVKGLIESAKYVKMQHDPLETVGEIFSNLGTTHLSPVAGAAIGAVVGLLELMKRYGGSRR